MKKERSFEEATKRLETIVKKLESGSESLENSLKLFEEGTKISRFCYKVLENAEQKIQILTSENSKQEDENV